MTLCWKAYSQIRWMLVLEASSVFPALIFDKMTAVVARTDIVETGESWSHMGFVACGLTLIVSMQYRLLSLYAVLLLPPPPLP